MKKPQALDQDGNPIPAKYDPGDFIVAPSDARGVSYRLTFRVAPDTTRAIDQILQSNRFPLSTRGDFLRFAVRETIRLLEQMEPVVSVSKRIDMLSTMLAEEQAHAEFMTIFDQLGDTISKYMADQAPDQALRVVTLAKHQFETMPPGYWRDKYLTELAKRFATLGKNGSGSPGIQLPGAKVVDVDADQDGD